MTTLCLSHFQLFLCRPSCDIGEEFRVSVSGGSAVSTRSWRIALHSSSETLQHVGATHHKRQQLEQI